MNLRNMKEHILICKRRKLILGFCTYITEDSYLTHMQMLLEGYEKEN